MAYTRTSPPKLRKWLQNFLKAMTQLYSQSKTKHMPQKYTQPSSLFTFYFASNIVRSFYIK